MIRDTRRERELCLYSHTQADLGFFVLCKHGDFFLKNKLRVFGNPESSNLGFPGGSDGKESACSAGDRGLIFGSRRPPGVGNGNPLQHSYLENSMDNSMDLNSRGDW